MVLFISKRGERDIGAITHLKVLNNIYGEQNVFIVDLVSAMTKRDKNYVAYNRTKNVFERLKRWLQGNNSYISNRIIREICDIVVENKIDLVFSEESILGYLMRALKKRSPETRIVCFYHDISADLFAQYKKKMPKGLYYKLIECNLTIRQERINQKYSDENWVFHVSDAEKFESYYGYQPTAIIPLANLDVNIPERVKNIVTKSNQEKEVLFVCSEYFVNILGFKWFYENVLPKVKGKFHLKIVGTGSDALADFCKDTRVTIVGKVDDLSEYYLNADIIITPIFDGGGMKMKTLEALSYGKYLVGTTKSLHGYWEEMPDVLRNHKVYQCDTAEDWIQALNNLIGRELNKFNEDEYMIYRKCFSYEALCEHFRKNLIV